MSKFAYSLLLFLEFLVSITSLGISWSLWEFCLKTTILKKIRIWINEMKCC